MRINTDKIRLIAAQQGLNLGKLAEKAGVSRQTLSTTMTRGTCRTETVVKIYDALGLDPGELLHKEAHP